MDDLNIKKLQCNECKKMVVNLTICNEAGGLLMCYECSYHLQYLQYLHELEGNKITASAINNI